MLLLGGIELGRLALTRQKVDKVVHAMADLITRGTTVSVADLEEFARAVDFIMMPLTFDGTVIFSGVSRFTPGIPPCPDDEACITWQHTPRGNDTSLLGIAGGPPTFPNGFTLGESENVVVVEVFHRHVPFTDVVTRFIPGMGERIFYLPVVYRPRLGDLTQLDP